MQNKVWFITGTSTGFGSLLSKKLLERGDCVVATARRHSAFKQFERYDPSLLLTCELDVTRPEQIKSAVEDAIDQFGRIDVLVNNAGYGYFSTFEEADLNEVRMMFDVNVYGLIEMTQAVLPIMREQKSGAIVNISSISGRITTARGAFYQSSKWAVEALSESLFIETHPFGIRVLVIEPGSYETDFGPRSTRNTISPAYSPYVTFSPSWAKGRSLMFPERRDPTEVIDVIIGAVDGNAQFDRIPIGPDALDAINRRDTEGWKASLEDILQKYS